MKGTQLLLGCLGLVVSAIGVAVPAYIAYDLYGTGPSAERRLELERGFKLNPIGAFSNLAGKAQVSIAFEGRPLRNLFVERDILRNTGRVPILPSDYVEKLTVSAQMPWTILDVDGALKAPGNVVLHWKRKSDTCFEAEPALLNPGDTASTDIYLTTVQDVSGPDVKQTLEPAVKWDARIVNLRAISPPQRPAADYGYDSFFPVLVFLQGKGLLFTLVAAMLFEALYIILLVRAGLLRTFDSMGILLLLCVSLLSFSAAESSAWFLFPSWWSRLVPSNGINFCVLSVHWVALLTLYFYARRQRSTTNAV